MLKRVLNIIITTLSIIAGLISSIMILNIYYSGKDSGEIYTVSTFSSHAVGFYISLSLFIICIILSVIFHYRCDERKMIVKSDDIDIYNLLKSRKDLSSLDEENARKLKKYKNSITIAYVITIILSIGLIIFPICYISNAKNFDANGNMISQAISLASHSLPFLCVIYAIWSILYFYRLSVVRKELDIIKTSKNKTHTKPDNKSEKIVINVLRVAIFAIAISFIITGIVNKETNDILLKAINICTECIGLG